jgi:hypothetical protein
MEAMLSLFAKYIYRAKMCDGGVEETEEEVASCMTHASISLWRTAT